VLSTERHLWSQKQLPSSTRATQVRLIKRLVYDIRSDFNLVYENPLITATSRTLIADIYKATHQFQSPSRPLAALSTLFNLSPCASDSTIHQAIRVWSDVIDIFDNESVFDGHHKVVVEHTLNILLLPSIHCEGDLGRSAPSTGPQSDHPFILPSISIPGTSMSVPSPLHLKLHIVTALSFNEEGLVTHHRDIWDVKDVVGLVPGMSLAQWVGSRITASGMSYASHFFSASSPLKAH